MIARLGSVSNDCTLFVNTAAWAKEMYLLTVEDSVDQIFTSKVEKD